MFSAHSVNRKFGDPYRIRTDVNGVRGRCLNHLTNGPRALPTELWRNVSGPDSIESRPVLALPIFPGRHQPSIVGRDELNYRVRNGNGWTLALISTNLFIRVLPEEQTDYNVFNTLCQ